MNKDYLNKVRDKHFLEYCVHILYISVYKKVKQFKTDFVKLLNLFSGCDYSIILHTCIFVKKGFDTIKAYIISLIHKLVMKIISKPRIRLTH